MAGEGRRFRLFVGVQGSSGSIGHTLKANGTVPRSCDMHLTRMRFCGVPPFTEPVEFRFDDLANVFVGVNAAGKSRLLLAIDDYFNESAADRQRRTTPEQFDLRLIFCEESDYGSDWTKGKNLLCADSELAMPTTVSISTPVRR